MYKLRYPAQTCTTVTARVLQKCRAQPDLCGTSPSKHWAAVSLPFFECNPPQDLIQDIYEPGPQTCLFVLFVDQKNEETTQMASARRLLSAHQPQLSQVTSKHTTRTAAPSRAKASHPPTYTVHCQAHPSLQGRECARAGTCPHVHTIILHACSQPLKHMHHGSVVGCWAVNNTVCPYASHLGWTCKYQRTHIPLPLSHYQHQRISSTPNATQPSGQDASILLSCTQCTSLCTAVCQQQAASGRGRGRGCCQIHPSRPGPNVGQVG